MSPKKHLLSFLLVSMFAVALSKPRWEIHVKNGLSNGQVLIAHCKSKDNDLGERTLKVGEDFMWDFKVNFWRTTLFWCYLRKPKGEYATFDAFWVEEDTEWLRVKCLDHKCYWIAHDTGIYLKDNTTKVDEIYVHPWELPVSDTYLPGPH